MEKNILVKGLLIAVSLPLLAGCVVYERPPRAVVAPAGSEVVVDAGRLLEVFSISITPRPPPHYQRRTAS
jgi:hypothetical protein